jgi:hypothetical protein
MSGTGSVAGVSEYVPTLTVYDCEAVTEFASVASTVNVNEPDAVGVPLIVPVDVPSERPVGSAPDVTVKVIGVVPPDVCTVSL